MGAIKLPVRVDGNALRDADGGWVAGAMAPFAAAETATALNERRPSNNTANHYAWD